MDQEPKDQPNPSNETPEVEAELVEPENSSIEPFYSSVPATQQHESKLPSTDHLPQLDFSQLDIAEVKIDKVSEFEPVVRRLIEAQATRTFLKVQDEIARGVLDKNTYNEIKSVLEMVKLYRDISTPVDQISIKSSGQGGRNILAQLFEKILNPKNEE